MPLKIFLPFEIVLFYTSVDLTLLPPGRYSGIGSSSCSSCAAGKYQSDTGSISCFVRLLLYNFVCIFTSLSNVTIFFNFPSFTVFRIDTRRKRRRRKLSSSESILWQTNHKMKGLSCWYLCDCGRDSVRGLRGGEVRRQLWSDGMQQLRSRKLRYSHRVEKY